MSLDAIRNDRMFRGVPTRHFRKDRSIVTALKNCPECEKRFLLIYRRPRPSPGNSKEIKTCQNPLCEYSEGLE